MARDLVATVFKDSEVKILDTFKGKDLEFKKYEPLYDFATPEIQSKAYFITCDDYVTTEDGTGIVHIAPAFGEDDNRVCKKYSMPFVQQQRTNDIRDEMGWSICKRRRSIDFAGFKRV